MSVSADSLHDDGVSTRYTVAFEQPDGQLTEIRAITSAGAPMAVALATARLLMKQPDTKFTGVAIVNAETQYEADPAEDVIDYWNTA